MVVFDNVHVIAFLLRMDSARNFIRSSQDLNIIELQRIAQLLVLMLEISVTEVSFLTE